MDLRKLKKLIDLVQESGIGEIEITEGEEKVKIVKGGAAAAAGAATLPRPILCLGPGSQAANARTRCSRA